MQIWRSKAIANPRIPFNLLKLANRIFAKVNILKPRIDIKRQIIAIFQIRNYITFYYNFFFKVHLFLIKLGCSQSEI